MSTAVPGLLDSTILPATKSPVVLVAGAVNCAVVTASLAKLELSDIKKSTGGGVYVTRI